MSFIESLEKIRIIMESLDSDDMDKIELLNNEADYSSLMDWAITKRAEALAMEESIKALIEKYNVRKNRAAANAEKMKEIMHSLMDSAGETKYKSPAGTVTVKQLDPKPVIVSPDLVPEKYCKREVSKTLVNKAIENGESVPGVTMSNGGVSVTVRIA